MLTGEPPERMVAPTTAIKDIYVVISWSAPFDNYLPITSYQVLLLLGDGTYGQLPDLCDGSDT